MPNSIALLVRKVGFALIGEVVSGDLVGLEFIFDMPTAIVGLYTREGFALGADRRCRDSETGTVRDTLRKVFSAEADGIRMAYALAGGVGITVDKTSETIFDFLAATREWMARPFGVSSADFTSYGHSLASDINQKMVTAVAEANRAGRLTLYPSDLDGDIAHMFLLGYFKGLPGVITV